MPPAKSFTFGSYAPNADTGVISFSYRAELEDGAFVEYIDSLQFFGTTGAMWDGMAPELLESLLQNLSLVLGINYWKLHPTSKLQIETFTLTRSQADFWNELYTKGLSEFFYRMQIDFRGLVAFPYDESTPEKSPVRLNLSSRALLMNGGGKDSIVSAEMLKERGDPFDLFVVNETPAQRNVAGLIGRPVIGVSRTRDPSALNLERRMQIHWISPLLTTYTFIASLAAALFDYNTIIFSDERSADVGNINYLGLEVNHQWSKSSEAEALVNNYITRFISEDISTFSLLRPFSELEIVRRFAAYPRYFGASSSCNQYFFLSQEVKKQLAGRAYWCNECPKCVFLFACFSAFLPKKTVLDIFGVNLYADVRLLPIFRQLLGLEGFKPFECVGEPEEMQVAMRCAARSGSYNSEPAMLLLAEVPESAVSIEDMERRVLSTIDAPAQNSALIYF